MRREIVVLLTRAPYGRVHVPEGLRAARGVAAGFDRHDVSVVFTQDAVYAATESVDREALNMPDHIADLRAEDGELIVDERAMTERGVSSREIADDVSVRAGDDVTAMIADADHTLDF